MLATLSFIDQIIDHASSIVELHPIIFDSLVLYLFFTYPPPGVSRGGKGTGEGVPVSVFRDVCSVPLLHRRGFRRSGASDPSARGRGGAERREKDATQPVALEPS